MRAGKDALRSQKNARKTIMSTNERRDRNLSRRNLLKLAGVGAGLTFLQRRSGAVPITPNRFVDRLAMEQVADRDPALRLPILMDMQTHVWWRAGGIRKMNERADAFLKSL